MDKYHLAVIATKTSQTFVVAFTMLWAQLSTNQVTFHYRYVFLKDEEV